MKNRYLIAINLFGMVLMIFGGLFKVMHYPYASALLVTATFFEAFGLLVLIAKLLKSKGGQKFLDS